MWREGRSAESGALGGPDKVRPTGMMTETA